MAEHINPDDRRYRDAAELILIRHGRSDPEANITSAVRDFLTITKLVRSDEIVEETPPSDSSRRAVDLTALDTFIEFKRRTGTAPGGAPDPAYVKQLDDYLAESAKNGHVRMGVLTDGKRWLLRWPGAGGVRLTKPYAFTLEDPDQWLALYEWLRDSALVAVENVSPNREKITEHFGPGSPSYQRDIAALKALYQENADSETIRIKRGLWYDLLRTALGEVAYTPEEMDDLFVRHTYLTAVVGMTVQASFGIDVRSLAENDPADLIEGRKLFNDTGLQGVLESDFFTWINEVGGSPLLQTLARRVARFDWAEAPPNIGAILYESVIPPDERKELGEYYTPDWLARAMVHELVTDPLNQRVLDPACGSGAFITEAIAHFIEAANSAGWDSNESLSRLRDLVTGIDIHPVAVHLARTAWTLAALPLIKDAAAAGAATSLSIPIYLGDALQLRFRNEDMFAEDKITIQTRDEENTQLVFPLSLVERAEDFDALMGDVSTYIERGDDPSLALNDNGIHDQREREVAGSTIAEMQRLHHEGRNHIWAYYTRNMVRPVALSHAKVDVVIGNPPWINYNQTADILRDELVNLSRNRYGIWAGGRYATHQDVAGLFFARSVDLYLKDNGVIGFVLPHSALQAGHYSRWRSGEWRSTLGGSSNVSYLNVDFTLRPAWDLERLEPNTFFPIPASVAFARKLPSMAKGKPLAGSVERWQGRAGAGNVRREPANITDTGITGGSPYAAYSRQGATIVPRRLFFVEETANTAIVQAGQTITVNPRRGSQDKAPWNALDLTAITGQTIERAHLFDVHLGETVAPYVTLDPLKALLPVKQGDAVISTDDEGPGGIGLGGLERRMRERWRTVNRLWEENKERANQLSLLQRLDYVHNLSAQFGWMQTQKTPVGALAADLGKETRPVRVVYTSAGQPTATVVQANDNLIDYKLFWIVCKDMNEANYLLAIINSDTLKEAVAPLMSKGLFGARDLQKHLWKLAIPEFDPDQELHTTIADAGATAAREAEERLTTIRAWCEREEKEFTVAIARRELRRWLRASPEGAAVESAVGELLAGR